MTEYELIQTEIDFLNGNDAQWIYSFPNRSKSGKHIGSFQIPCCSHCGSYAPIADINGKAFIVLKKECPCCGRRMSKHCFVSKEPFIIDETGKAEEGKENE